MSRTVHEQLSFAVKSHRAYGSPSWGSIRLKGDITVRQDFNDGDRLLFTLAGADGEIITRVEAEIGVVTFKPVYAQGAHIGIERQHTADVTRELLTFEPQDDQATEPHEWRNDA